ncbi:solute carrier family 35 member E2A isoform X1 [Ixodes scapularis]|uniref:solute carrier family 35 member E2A isoform X1 n=2 Tax=Ixodes scapularis TaxID=6945 RepID=UPI001A9F07B4|nr:solute carrier family 35 member E2A isoform X1 [Ixodes scapularis]
MTESSTTSLDPVPMAAQPPGELAEDNEVLKGWPYTERVNHRGSKDLNAKGMHPFYGPFSREVELKSLPSGSLEKRSGLYSGHAVVVLVVWYLFSFTTLMLNKCILTYQSGDPVVLGAVQMLTCFICGYVQMRATTRRKLHAENSPKMHNVILVGSLRFSTVFLGLVALWYVPVSFAETVKSSAPVFTVVISRLVLGETTTWLVNMSLFPVMGGLALCSANELSFNLPGFMASLCTNLSECFQNVFSKRLLSDEKVKLLPVELQCYTSLSSVFILVPATLALVDFRKVWEHTSWSCLGTLALGGISFHCQSFTEYILLGYISPVTHSVANTVKRALMIWLSILVFGNNVTFLSGLGTLVVTAGVFLYNHARNVAAKLDQYDVTLSTVKVTDHDV